MNLVFSVFMWDSVGAPFLSHNPRDAGEVNFPVSPHNACSDWVWSAFVCLFVSFGYFPAFLLFSVCFSLTSSGQGIFGKRCHINQGLGKF